jgi:hypothetical protein
MDQPIRLMVAGKRLPNDSQLMYSLRDIPDTGLRIRLATIGAEKKMSASAMKFMIKRNVNRRERKPRHSAHENTPSMGVRLQASGGHWNSIAQLGFQPNDRKLAAAAEATCLDCPLYEVAEDKTCRECPLVDFLRRMQ